MSRSGRPATGTGRAPGWTGAAVLMLLGFLDDLGQAGLDPGRDLQALAARQLDHEVQDLGVLDFLVAFLIGGGAGLGGELVELAGLLGPPRSRPSPC